MEWFSAAFFTALFSIIVIDLVLAGDNAIVIGMAARNLDKRTQKKVILWGTVGAIAIRAAATLAVVALLDIPGLLLAGGALLLWIAFKLLTEKKKHEIRAKDHVWAAVRTIIVADAVMGMDNVIAVAGASHGSFALVLIGLLVSIPIVIWGSTLFIKWLEKYPVIIYIGAGVLALTAGKMMTGEPFLAPYIAASPLVKWSFIILLTAAVLTAGKWRKMAGYIVEVGAEGELTLPKELSDEAHMEPEDQYTVKMDARGKLVLVKAAAGEPCDEGMQHAG